MQNEANKLGKREIFNERHRGNMESRGRGGARRFYENYLGIKKNEADKKVMYARGWARVGLFT